MVTIVLCLFAFFLLGFSLGRTRWPSLVPAALALYIVLGTLFEGIDDTSNWVYFLGVASACLVTGLVGVLVREHTEQSQYHQPQL